MVNVVQRTEYIRPILLRSLYHALQNQAQRLMMLEFGRFVRALEGQVHGERLQGEKNRILRTLMGAGDQYMIWL